jgi:hypothetical protein
MRGIFEFCFGILYIIVFFHILETYAHGSFVAGVLIGAGYGSLSFQMYDFFLQRRLRAEAKALEDAQEGDWSA